MTKDEIEILQDAIVNEGLDYALVYYSDWKEIKDKKFQLLLKNHLKTRIELKNYLEIYNVITDI